MERARLGEGGRREEGDNQVSSVWQMSSVKREGEEGSKEERWAGGRKGRRTGGQEDRRAGGQEGRRKEIKQRG